MGKYISNLRVEEYLLKRQKSLTKIEGLMNFITVELRISVHQSHDEESGRASHILAEVICNTYLKMHFYL